VDEDVRLHCITTTTDLYMTEDEYRKRLLSRVVIQDECWLYPTTPRGSNYGKFCLYGVRMSAHRASWWLHFGEDPREFGSGQQINHHCDKPNCIRPEHLYRGTQKDNMADAIYRGRRKAPQIKEKGVRAAKNKLRNAEIQALHKQGLSYRAIAKQVNISHSQVSNILRDLERG
jgi:hypothetical protein